MLVKTVSVGDRTGCVHGSRVSMRQEGKQWKKYKVQGLFDDIQLLRNQISSCQQDFYYETPLYGYVRLFVSFC